MDIVTMKLAGKKTTPANPAKATKNGFVAAGTALAKVCINYATARMQAEEKEQGKLMSIVASIGKLEHSGHAEFRAELTKEVQLLKAIRDSVGVTKSQTAGYTLDSFEVLVSNWKTISTAVENGLLIAGKPYRVVVAESVAMKHAIASTGKDGKQTIKPIVKTGRKAIDPIELAKRPAIKLDNKQFAEFCAWASAELATRNAKKPAIRVVKPALV